MDGPPPPPPPHGENPNTTHGFKKGSGLPDGNYDIFIIPPHSSGSGFLYLPSLQTHRNSFLAGAVSALAVVYIWQTLSPIVKAWYLATAANGGGMGVAVLLAIVGIAGWGFGAYQAHIAGANRDSGGSSQSRQSGPGAPGGPGGAGFGGHGAAGGGGSYHQSSGAGPGPDYSRGPNFGGPNPGPQGAYGSGGNYGAGPGPGGPYPGNQYGAGTAHPPPNAGTPPHTPPPNADPGPEKAEPTSGRSESKSKSGEDWERAREETRRKEELKRKMEEFKRKREAEAREKQKQREREAMERELRERREQLEREMAEAKEKAEREARERAEKEAAEARAKIERELAEAKAKAEREAAEARERAEREAAEAKTKAEREAAEARAQRLAALAKEREARAKAKAEKEAAEAKAKAEKEAAEKEAAAKAAAKKEADAKFAALKEAAAKKYAEKKAKDAQEAAAKEETAAKAASNKSPTGSTAPRTPSPKKPAYTGSARTPTTADEDDAYSFRPYDRPRRPYAGTSGSSVYSESSYAPSQSTARTTPPPSTRGAYSTKDPDKIVIRGVYAFNNAFLRSPVAQLVSGQGMVTDGLVLRITTEGLFIDDDIRGVPQREWDVKAWTMKLVEVWCPQYGATAQGRPNPKPANVFFRRSTNEPTPEESDANLVNFLKVCKNKCRLAAPDAEEHGGLHVLRASIRDQEGRRYVFVLQETEGWKVAVGLQRLRKGTQARALGVLGMAGNECRTLLGNLGYVA
ncbi:uncharacterized protein NFIA_018800 [Aspergillus fischeri NRRL 181]|uniref:Trans-sialidase n=1 Tax=Neosartorya fischeri (strain ATCC 1020 / DSM 3700 / CBS 544.65 / FGSC A1164 / JCM 1740 / NRRL 181 / WB 181) TaxID=331117 RepID=A1D436_NEOFI|nr:conserved hypothetical protein [Aspergillus fischeri NRRL 181]EAW23179.1 conserved hypothetical protein [Aspergillus fischeri NRRL 181]